MIDKLVSFFTFIYIAPKSSAIRSRALDTSKWLIDKLIRDIGPTTSYSTSIDTIGLPWTVWPGTNYFRFTIPVSDNRKWYYGTELHL